MRIRYGREALCSRRRRASTTTASASAALLVALLAMTCPCYSEAFFFMNHLLRGPRHMKTNRTSNNVSQRQKGSQHRPWRRGLVTFLDPRKRRTRRSSTASSTEEETSPPESVHLQLTEHHAKQVIASDRDSNHQEIAEDAEISSSTASKKNNTVRVHSFVDEKGDTWMGLNTAKRKFEAFLNYSNATSLVDRHISTQEVQLDAHNATTRDIWRACWKERRLLTDRTELLAVYPSDSSPSVNTKRGGFPDLLHLYTDRFTSILRDEMDTNTSLVDWLNDTYGNETTQLTAEELASLPLDEQIGKLQTFLEWFRSYFPYYYDRCASCGASLKEDMSSSEKKNDSDNSSADSIDDDTEDDSNEFQTFLGYMYPSEDELIGKASRTELYHCHMCGHFTRFPRFNSARHIMKHQRGRCGEYSMLLFRFLRALGHECRWVVDWADHVWAECRLSDPDTMEQRWTHIDPCEAVVDDPLLYEGWGKKQTYIIAFHSPQRNCSTSFPLIQDVTKSYTSDTWDEIIERRDESKCVATSTIDKALERLRSQL